MAEEPVKNLLLKAQATGQHLINSVEGQDLVEYALLVSLIALAAITGVKHVASAVTAMFSNVSSSLA
jgi:pilus assembly protein Flp/PilA